MRLLTFNKFNLLYLFQTSELVKFVQFVFENKKLLCSYYLRDLHNLREFG